MIKLKAIWGRIYKDIKEYGWAVIAFGIYYVLIHVLFDAFCPLLVLTGIPCAGCGMTRAFWYLLRGQFERAMYMNPSVLPVICFLLYFCSFRYGLGQKVKGVKGCLVVLVAVVLFIYGYRMHLYFPDRIPYVFHSDNILVKHLPGYESFIKSLMKLF